MSDQNEMTDEQLRVEVAQCFGYRFVDEGWRYPNLEDWQKYKAVYKGEGFIGLSRPDWLQVPDYTGDLNVAFKLVDAMRKSNCHLEIEVITGEVSPWRVTVFRQFQTNAVCNEFGGNLARLLCTAFLRVRRPELFT